MEQEKINDLDMNDDGVVDQSDLAANKLVAQKRMAWVALASMIIFTIILFTPIISETRLEKLSSISDLFYISMAGVVGSFMGMTAWISRK